MTVIIMDRSYRALEQLNIKPQKQKYGLVLIFKKKIINI